MKRTHQYEMEIFVSRKLGFGFMLETKQVGDYSYVVKMLRFDPEGKIKDRETTLRSTIGGCLLMSVAIKLQNSNLLTTVN